MGRRLVLALLLTGCAAAHVHPEEAPFAEGRVAGNVLEVDAAGGEVLILDAGRRRRVRIAVDTVIREGNHDRSVADLARGDRIVVSIDSDRAGTARLIAIAGPAASGRAPRISIR